MKLYNIITKEQILVGETVIDFRNEKYTLLGFTPPHKPGSTGRIDVQSQEETIINTGKRKGEVIYCRAEYYPSVFNLIIK